MVSNASSKLPSGVVAMLLLLLLLLIRYKLRCCNHSTAPITHFEPENVFIGAKCEPSRKLHRQNPKPQSKAPDFKA